MSLAHTSGKPSKTWKADGISLRFLITYCRTVNLEMSQIAPGCRPELETLIFAAWSEVHVEGIAREANRDRIVGCHVDS
jgi:hypothetical protein